jgi:hypothetical protein
MDMPMMAIAAIAAVLVIAPLVAILVVSFASLREENARSLSRSAPGPMARLARRVVGFRSDMAPAPEPKARAGQEVHFAYAGHTLPAPRQHAAGHQPQPRPIRLGQRQPAGV